MTIEALIHKVIALLKKLLQKFIALQYNSPKKFLRRDPWQAKESS